MENKKQRSMLDNDNERLQLIQKAWLDDGLVQNS